MINDHLYEGRFTPRVGGKRISKNLYAKTREECEEKLAELIKTMKAESQPKRKRQNRHNERGLTDGQPLFLRKLSDDGDDARQMI